MGNEMLKFKVGQVWKDRNGDSLEITSVNILDERPVSARQMKGGNKDQVFTFTRNGSFLYDSDPCHYDLHELVIEPASASLILEVGKTYVTADGTPVKIESMDHDADWPFNGSDGDCYRADGRCDGVPSRRDLVAELQEPQAVPVGPDAAAPADRAEDRGFFLDQLVFEIIRANPGAASQYLCHAFLALADARSQA